MSSILVVAMCLPSLCTGYARRNFRGPQDVGPIVIRVDKTRRGVTYEVNSKPTGSTASTDILHLLAELQRQHGSNTPVLVLLDPRVPIEQIWNVNGIAGKAQLDNIHFFVLDPDTEKMLEIKWESAVPFSTNPAPN
jgi:biopolymer transport protein ExbD